MSRKAGSNRGLIQETATWNNRPQRITEPVPKIIKPFKQQSIFQGHLSPVRE